MQTMPPSPPPHELNGVAKCVFPGTEGLKWEGTRKEELRAAFVQLELELD
jgi:hypothetical protein